MRRRRVAWILLTGAVASGLLACRAIVGVTDLTVGSDASKDHATDEAVEASAPDAEAGMDAGRDTGRDAGADTMGMTMDTGKGVDCAFQPPADASAGRIDCVDGCISGHAAAAPDFYGVAMACLCRTDVCKSECEAFCNKACVGVQTMGGCNDCANHAIVDEAGACHADEDTTCKAGCGSFATCIAQCPSQ